MASGQYQLKANFTFPLTTTEYMAFLEHAKDCADITIDLSGATFNAGGFSSCLQWLQLMQIVSKGGISQLQFSFDSLITAVNDADRIQLFTKTFAQSNIFFNFVEVLLVSNPEFLEKQAEPYQKVYASLQIMLKNKQKKIQAYPDFVLESKKLLQEFRANIS